MAPSAPTARRRRGTLTGRITLSDRVFLSGNDKALARSVDAGLERVEDALRADMRFADELADVTARYLLDAGGKRVRPMLIVLISHLGDGVTPEIVTAAEAIEITHLASLYHDDVMDEAQMRRGVPSAHVAWGNSVAVLTGDLLFARASKLISSLGERAIRIQADTFERLCLGQLHETVGPRPGEDAIEHYLRVLADKTGALIAAAAQMGVVFSNADEAYAPAVVEFGEKIGVAFQLIDDVIDLSARAEETGKTPGTDLKAGVATLPLLKLRRRDDAASLALLDRLESEVIGADENVDVTDAVAALREHPVTRETLDDAHVWAHEAVAALDPLPNGAVKKALIKFADTIVDRSS